MEGLSIQQAIHQAFARHQAGELGAAESMYRQILQVDSANVDALHLLGVLLHTRGDATQACELIARAIAINPAVAEFYNNHARALRELGKLDEARDALGKALSLRPEFPEALNNLGGVLKEMWLLEEAAVPLREAVRLRPDFAVAHVNLGSVLREMGRVDEALSHLRQAVQLQPNSAAMHLNLGNVLHQRGQLDDAADSYRTAIQLRPDYATAHNNLGTVLRDQGRLDESVTSYREALNLNPDHPEAHSNYLYLLYFHPRFTGQQILDEHKAWGRRVMASATAPSTFLNTPEPERRLKIGYVSPDFREHVVGRFLLPLLANHDRAQFEIIAYSDVLQADAMTQRLRGHCDRWHSILGSSDEQVAERIRADGVDILIDLTLHMAYNRMRLFARKPAPVQATYLAYAGTSGLPAIDYRITDRYLDPPEDGPGPYSERSVRIDSYWCYQGPADAPEIGPLPALLNRHVTFGCLNTFTKVSPEALEVWCRILGAVPDSRLVLHAETGRYLDRTREFVRARNVDPARIEFRPKMRMGDYLAVYNAIDIALDPFPYAGGTTSCDAMWMGVPVVTLAGQTAVGRAGVSLLNQLRLTELIGRSADEYVTLASDLARDIPRLSELRRTLRYRMVDSPLCDAPAFARSMEEAYRTMWREWCAKAAGSM